MFMWAAVVEVELPKGFGQGPGARAGSALRYAGVLAVWVGLALIRPSLARQIWRERRTGPPLGRPSAWPSGLTQASESAVRRLKR
jgi:hypothetical protein